jgi:hypothetical protein
MASGVTSLSECRRDFSTMKALSFRAVTPSVSNRGGFSQNEPVVFERAIRPAHDLHGHVPVDSFTVEQRLDKVWLTIRDIEKDSILLQNPEDLSQQQVSKRDQLLLSSMRFNRALSSTMQWHTSRI